MATLIAHSSSIITVSVEKIIDYAGATTSSSPSIKTSKTVIDILQKHYCERLGKAVVCRCPWVRFPFFKKDLASLAFVIIVSQGTVPDDISLSGSSYEEEIGNECKSDLFFTWSR